MAVLTPADVKNVAHLARLGINESEVQESLKKLSSILDLVAQMDSVDISAVTPMAHPLDVRQPLRPDRVTEVNQRELFQSIAPAVAEGLYLVPKVIE